jgi:hypothetical protein
MCIEEMSELTKELCKIKRAGTKKDYIVDVLRQVNLIRENVIEEMADVEITLAQQKIIFGCEEEVKKQIDFKLNRLKERLKNEL